MKREDFVSAARSYLGTPFHHQGRLKGIGVDCAGLVVLAARDCGYTIRDMQGYATIPSQNLFMQSVMEHCTPIAIGDVLPGDVAMFRFDSEPQHIAIISDIAPDITLLHAYQQAGKVCENHMGGLWHTRLCGFYRLKGIE